MSDNMDAPKCERHGYIECKVCSTVLDIVGWLRGRADGYRQRAQDDGGDASDPFVCADLTYEAAFTGLAGEIERKWLDENPARD